VAVLDSDPDTTEMLKTWLEFNGLVVATGNLTDFRLGKDDLLDFLERTAPDIIVYDLGPPYETNFDYLRKIQNHPSFPACRVVVTTTNARVVETLFGIQAIEILGKPYDLGAIVNAVSAEPEPQVLPNGDAGQVERRSDDRRHGDRRLGDRRHGDHVH